MSTDRSPSSPGDVKLSETACGSRIMVTPDTHYIHYLEEVVYFCGHDCKQLYDEDPLNSCMAARLLSGK
jgi:YHS domain-containing protein